MATSATIPGQAKALSFKVLVLGFIAGALAVPLGHQIVALILYFVVQGRAFPWDMTPQANAHGLPRVVNLSFWGGVWGILWALISPVVPRGSLYYVIATIFGAICATAVSAYVVTYLKGLPAGSFAGYGLYLNAGWGLAAAAFFELLKKKV